MPLILVWVKNQNGVGSPDIVAAPLDTAAEQGSPEQGFTATITGARRILETMGCAPCFSQ
ncbi:hypothetical protein D082_50770 (plasmid) [Synechocystis sp. PCC 6714]|nr:hypothetical protein D082_50770 [Synechocystis sp. PCC 6714]